MTLRYYAEHAGELSRLYASAAGGIARYFAAAFPPGGRVLDVGCGAGRDFIRLMRSGYDAFAVDACAAMAAAAMAECRRRKMDVEDRIFTESLPDLSRFGDAEFDGLLCSAVLMHLPESEMPDAACELRRILKPGGKVLLSVPLRNDEVDPLTRRDAKGRLYTDLPPEKLGLFMERAGFRLLWSKVSADSLGRDSRTWAVMLLAKAGGISDRPPAKG